MPHAPARVDIFTGLRPTKPARRRPAPAAAARKSPPKNRHDLAAENRHELAASALQQAPDWRRKVSVTVDYLRAELAKLERVNPKAAEEIADRLAGELMEGGAVAANRTAEARY